MSSLFLVAYCFNERAGLSYLKQTSFRGILALKHVISSSLLLGTFAIASVASAREYHDLFSTPLGLSMGGAVSSYVDDWNSLYYNPAGLAKVQKFTMRLPEIAHVEASAGIKDIIDTVKTLDKSQSIATQLQDFDGKTGSFRINPLNMSVFFNRIGLAINAADVKTAIRIQVPTIVFAKAYYDSRVDSGLSAGYGHSFLGDKVRVGFALRLLGRAGTSGYLEGQEIADAGETLGERAGAGIGIDADIGTQANMDAISLGKIKVTPMAGFVVQNLLATKYDLVRINQQEFKGTPPANERKMNVGVSAKVEGLGPFSFIPSFELRDILIDTNSFWEYVSTGVQVGLHGGYWFNGFIRSAYHKGALSTGIGGNLGPGELELGTYSVALGDGFGVGRDRRYYARLSLNW